MGLALRSQSAEPTAPAKSYDQREPRFAGARDLPRFHYRDAHAKWRRDSYSDSGPGCANRDCGRFNQRHCGPWRRLLLCRAGFATAIQYVGASAGHVAGAFTVDVLTDSGGSWLTASPPSGVTPASVTVTASPGSLVPGTYSGLVNVHGPGGIFAIEISAQVLGGTELAPSESSVDFAVTPAGAAPAQVSVSVETQCASTTGASCSAAPWTAGAATHSGGNWLGVTQSGSNVVMAVNPAGLGQGLYTGVITLTSPSAAQAQIGVTLTVAGTSDSLPALVADPPSVVFPNGNNFLGVDDRLSSGALHHRRLYSGRRDLAFGHFLRENDDAGGPSGGGG